MIPSVGKSGTSRIRLARSSSVIALPPRGGRASAAAGPAPAPPRPGLSRSSSAAGAPLEVARAQRGRDDLLEQRRLAPGRGAKGAEVPGVDPVPRDLGARERDVGVALAVEALAAFDPRREQAEVLELARELGRDARRGRTARTCRSPPPARAGRRRGASRGRRSGHELLADHPQRQELVALQAQDRDQSLDIGLGEQPVAAARSARLQQALILEVADLRDRDVGELVPQALADGADRVQVGGRARFRERSSSAQERHPVFADLDLVVVLEHAALDPPLVDERAVEAAEIANREDLRRRGSARRAGARP